MRTLHLMIAVALVLAAGPAGSPPAQAQSSIGVYVTESPGSAEDAILDAPAGGVYTVYLVCAEPENDDGVAIRTLGGYECELDVSGGWSFQSVALPADVLDFDSSNEAFFCSGLIPVSGTHVTLATIDLMNYSPAKGWVWIGPYSSAPSIPGHMAITDAGAQFALAKAYPSSGDYERPILGINQGPELQDETWSGVKALYQ